jgi:hypothetical protein
MDAITGGNARAHVPCTAATAEYLRPRARCGALCHPETIISAVTHSLGSAHRVCVADDCRMVDA